MASKRLYVGNLAYDVREEQLRELFAPYGPLTAVQIIGTRGFAFVEVPEERLQDALTLNGSLQFGRPIVVNEARPRGERPAPGAGGDRRPGMYRGPGDRGGAPRPQGYPAYPGYQGTTGYPGTRPGGAGRPGGGPSTGGRPGGGRLTGGRPGGRAGGGRPDRPKSPRSGRSRAERRERAERYDRRGW